MGTRSLLVGFSVVALGAGVIVAGFLYGGVWALRHLELLPLDGEPEPSPFSEEAMASWN